jgi:hypothetical protein
MLALERKIFYSIKALIPRRSQIFLRRVLVKYQRNKFRECWPIDRNASGRPDVWDGWPSKKKFALILTHDVESARGYAKVSDLAMNEEKLGFRSAFFLVPGKYDVNLNLCRELQHREFEVGIHGLYHDGKLFNNRKIFEKRLIEINNYIELYGAVGFRAPAMIRKLEWIHDIDIAYDASSFDTDPFQPQPIGTSCIFPFFISDGNRAPFVELPYTLPQDFDLYILMKEKTIDIWKKKIDWIADKGGMALVITHPDYMALNGEKPKFSEYPAELYYSFLKYVKQNYSDEYWHILPKEMADFWYRTNNIKQSD